MGVRGIVARVVGFILGVAVGFFGSLNSIFSDGGTAERVNAILLTAAVIGIVSAVAGAIDRGAGWGVAVWVWLPGAAIMTTYVAMHEYSMWLWAILVGVVTLGAAVVGALLGGQIGGRVRVR